MLGDLLTAWAEFLGDRLVNACGQAAPSVVVYHGHAAPGAVNCETEGRLSVWWDPQITSQPGSGRGAPCGGPLAVTLGARWSRCWKMAEVTESRITLHDSDWSTDAASIADVAECIARQIVQVQCVASAPPADLDEYATAVLDLVTSLSFQSASPFGPEGPRAGVVWKATVGLRGASRSGVS